LKTTLAEAAWHQGRNLGNKLHWHLLAVKPEKGRLQKRTLTLPLTLPLALPLALPLTLP
jgi:hypothetical protein